MTAPSLHRLLAPASVALIGASPRPSSVGRHILCNLRAGGFAGPLHLVNPHHAEIEGIASVPCIADLPETDLLIVTTPPEAIPGIIEDAGKNGCGAAVIITAGLGQGPGSLSDTTRDAARAHGLRLLGPNCLGLQVPGAHLDASFAAHMPSNGGIALISQSGGVAAGLTEWARHRDIGFSAVVSIGNQIDVDFDDCLDHFAADAATRAIVLYVESIKDGARFIASARAAVRAKPVIVLKSGRHAQAASAARTHTGALAGSDAVYDAAFDRAGVIRVYDLQELFDAVETLSRVPPFCGDRLGIVTNGGGNGVLAVDRLIDWDGRLASLSAETVKALDRQLPPIWSRANPIDIAGDADAERYRNATRGVLADDNVDALLVMNVPTALASSSECVSSVVEAVTEHRTAHKGTVSKPVFAAWIGDDGAAARAFRNVAIPHYETEAQAVRGFTQLTRYHRIRQGLAAASLVRAADRPLNAGRARDIVRSAIEQNQTWLDPVQIEAVLTAYAIPVTPTVVAHNAEEAAALSRPYLREGAVAVKILSPDIVHKSDVGGVRLNLRTEAEVRAAASDILSQATRARPSARLTGLTIHPMIVRPEARELIAGVAYDKTFGPIVAFGAGGTAVQVVNDRSLAVPPLTLHQADTLMRRTRVDRVLQGYRNVRPADRSALALMLVRLSHLATDIPEIHEIDLNPVLADENGVTVLDARVAVVTHNADSLLEQTLPAVAEIV